jgi:magnesium chelatase subunit D
VGLGGLWLRGRAGPVRAAVLEALGTFGARLHPAMGDDALLGGPDLGATLAAGRLVTRAGVLAEGRFTLVMAERCPAALAARLAQRLDRGGAALVALDEAAAEGEGLPSALADRLGLFLDLDGLAAADVAELVPDPDRLARARALVAGIDGAAAVLPLAGAAAALGIGSSRAVLAALAAARAAAAWRGAAAVEEADLRAAAELVLAHRATITPEDVPDNQPPAPPAPPPEAQSEDTRDVPSEIPPEVLVEAARAALPPGLMARLSAGRAARALGGSGAGARRKGGARGRPLPARPGRPGGEARIDLIATLREAAPWQRIRRARTGRRLTVLPADLRIRRFEDRTDRVLILAVDASGSLAMTRLAEAKGAVERLLAEAYVSRDHVALVAFRGTGAELILPPTRSLVQAKRRLAGLPGGGGTPLAAALALVLETARQVRGRGLAPALAVLTDGKANVTRAGTPGRAQAMEEARQVAGALVAAGVPALVIDTGMRPQPQLVELARALDADLVSLPRADDRALAGAMGLALSRAGPGR